MVLHPDYDGSAQRGVGVPGGSLGRVDAVGFCRRRRTRRLLDTDLTVPNVLFDQHRMISGVIDWNCGVARGDGHFALSKLLHTLGFAALSPTADHHPSVAAVRRVDDYLAAATDPTARQADKPSIVRGAQGFSQTDTCIVLSAVSCERSQPAQRSFSRIPAIRAMRSISAGHAYRNGIR